MGQKKSKSASVFSGRRGAYLVLVVLLILHIAWLRWMGVLAIQNMRVAGVDPVGYYVYLPSLIFDRDLDFANDYEDFRGFGYVSPYQERTPTGRMPNPYPVGVAVLWLPFFLLGHLAAAATGAAANGLSAPYGVAIYLGNVVYGFAGIVLIYRLTERVFERGVALLSVSLIWFASGVLYYLFPFSPMSHMPSMFIVTLLITFWLARREEMNLWSYVALGALGGLAALVRWQNVLFLVLPAADFVVEARRRGVKREKALHVLAMVGAFLVVFFPQMIVWKVLYGSFVTVPQGAGFVSWFRPALFDVLFSSRHGLFTWTPVIVLAVIGLFMFPKEKRQLGYLLFAAFALQLYINSVAGWVGWSFGMRRFINCSGLFSLGLAAVITKIQQRVRLRYLVLIAIPLVIWNALFVLQYYAGRIPYDDYLTFDQFVVDKFRVLVLLLMRILE
jgi:hypothetical protein